MPKHAGAAAGNSDTSGLLPDSRARGKRAGAARTEFMNESGYPNGRPGYVIDYIIPLNEGGKDSTYNMRWEATDDVKVKAPKHEMPERAPKAERSGEPREHHKPADQ